MMRRRKECIITGQPGSQPQAPRILVFQGTVKPALVAVTVVLVACHGLTRAILCPRALMMCCFFFFFLARRPRRCPGSWSSPRHPRHSILQNSARFQPGRCAWSRAWRVQQASHSGVRTQKAAGRSQGRPMSLCDESHRAPTPTCYPAPKSSSCVVCSLASVHGPRPTKA